MHWSRSSYLLVGLLLACGFLPPKPTLAVPGIQSPYPVAVEVDLVVVPVAVTDRNGALVPGLSQTCFHIFEDGAPQEILQFDSRDAPTAIGLLLDNSGSMQAKLGEVDEAALMLARNSNPRDQLFVIHFNESIDFGLPADKAFTSNIRSLEAAIRGAPACGKTALYDAIVAGLEQLNKSSLMRKALVVVSDGGDNASHHTMQQALHLAAASKAVIYAISIADETSMEPKTRILRQLAKESGGILFEPKAVTMVPQVAKRITADLRTQYTLGYVSSNPKRDGSFRQIRVVVDAPGHRHLVVRTRAGYNAPNDQVSSLMKSDAARPVGEMSCYSLIHRPDDEERHEAGQKIKSMSLKLRA